MPKPDDFDLIPRNQQPGAGASGSSGAPAGGSPPVNPQPQGPAAAWPPAGGAPGEQAGYQQTNYQQPGYQQSGYQQPGYQQPGYPPAGYQQPAGPGGPRSPYGPPPEGGPEPPRRSWTWLITLGVVAFVAFAVGAALITLRDRLGPAEQAGAPTATAAATSATTVASELTPSGFLATLAALTTQTPQSGTPGAGVPGAGAPGAGTPDPVGTLIAMATATAQARGAPSPAPSPTAGPTATPTPCPVAVAPALAAAWQQPVFGCPLSEARTIWAAVEPFERGSMLWRSDTNRSYLFTLDSRWEVINAAWDGSEPAGRGDAPPGLFSPERGFGWAWSTQEMLFQRLGWATDIEKGFCAEVQEFEQGSLLQSSPIPSCTAENLYNQATAGDWRPILLAAHQSGAWSGALGGPPVVAAAPTRAISVAARPQSNGVFSARSPASLARPIVVDGALDEWPEDGWQPMVTLVEGVDRYSGAGDASGAFNLIWSPQGILLGVRVIDDRWRPGPPGTDLWQGDALELHLDTRLAEDYGGTTADGDDFQIGIAPTGNGGAIQVYRWLPLASEGAQGAQGQAVTSAGGYTLEILLPWSLFLLEPPQAGASFGFNLSISDNDSDTQSQESVISASPARTTFDNPTEWGTLVLLP